ncbi:2-amino-4-hydroxy-6-hydroxymethyldihydropteridine diphosphokinase [Psychrobacter urativorans]|uniref:2-amino-4-hydroxy-6- hydroxymethyldihydropteridine diphosphokinase n=1 Tax=Psychrobacter urativorans TaxID=45610 RepID=UPI000AC4C0B8|nr:2-amino-4-hydroxy-6-hydroxymethyldihydropteridine diphosphokinase [Psychrobacter urativorans]
MDVSRLSKDEPETLQAQAVAAIVLALGSNYQAEYYLPQVHQQLATLGRITSSSALQNPDFTSTLQQPKPDYINQCVYLLLTVPMTLQQLQHTFKAFEKDCHRCRQTTPTAIRQVSMDIDILLIRLNLSQEWIVMADRYPFKAHENVGIEELVETGL